MKFKIVADGLFEAKNILNAFLKISKYYKSLYSDKSPELLVDTGYIKVFPYEQNSIESFWWFNNSSCWKIKRQGMAEMYLYLPTMKYVYLTSWGDKKWRGTKNPYPLMQQSEEERAKLKIFETEEECLKWFSKKGR